jgi:hypothetical protein
MIKKRVEMSASRQVAPSAEDRIRCLEDLVLQVFGITVDTDEYPPVCPYCENESMVQCEGREMESSLARPWVITWKCPNLYSMD